MQKSFLEIFENHSWEEISEKINSKQEKDVIRAINNQKRNLDDFMALISPAAEPFLEEMAQISHQLTKERFGKTIQMYAPMYVSNECQNI
ncbi:hypothetical protein [Litoribacter populi]|uniref:hypothetical protein n=1 Tax=Litoribacter populi TaxID=2598460 RepID=UPI002938D31E|nr:hypothetical protein [Litoribacter populi]